MSHEAKETVREATATAEAEEQEDGHPAQEPADETPSSVENGADDSAHASQEHEAREEFSSEDASGRNPSEDASAGTGYETRHDDLERELAHLNDRRLRLAAEFENYRKRVRTEKRETWVHAQADLIRRLLDSVDDLQRVTLLDPATTSVTDVVEGVSLVERKVLRALEDIGLEVVDPAGEVFDPRVMEAVMMAPAESEDDDDTVGMVLQRGYLLKGHLVRPARVSVLRHG